MDRAKIVFRHLHNCRTRGLETRATAADGFPAGDDDVVVVSALRTPICKARRGHFKDTLPDDLLSTAFSAVIGDAGISPDQLQDICVGNVLQPKGGAAMARMAQFFSHIPETVPLSTVNRQCSSGLQACAHISNAIKGGVIDIGMAAGIESMTFNAEQFTRRPTESEGYYLNPKVEENSLARDVLIPMGITSENVAERFGITRKEQDQMGLESQQKAAAAQRNGWFNDEIIPVTTKVKDRDGNERQITVTADDGVRPATNMEGLAKLKPAFRKGGSTTAGNSSQVSDGAAAVIMARRSYAKQNGLRVLGVMRAFAVVGVPPDIMGIGPAVAIPAALEKAGLNISDIDIFEINEAFASQATYCVKKLGIPMEKVNPKGGAIALGHPLGCTGARQVATLLHELKRRGKRAYGVVSMCMGTGMGAAAVLEYPGPQ